jgi:hypothetical protein
MLKRLNALTWTPKFNVVLFALLLNYAWEFLQVPLFDRMPQAAHWEAVKACSSAAAGDAVIALIAFWVVALVAGSRDWVILPKLSSVLGFSACGLLITLVIERLALARVRINGWSYSALMPVIPVLGVGLSSLLQWVLLPPLVVWLVRRQLASRLVAG